MACDPTGRFLSVREAAQQLGIDSSGGLSLKNDLFGGSYTGRVSVREKLIRLSQDYPVLLLPLRLETRFRGSQLLIRIYPDQIVIDTHDPRLTEDEGRSGIEYHETLSQAESTDNPDETKRAAWRGLAARYGPERAAWIAKTTQGVNNISQLELKDPDWFDVPKVMGLPAYFAAFLYRGDELWLGPVRGNRVRRSLTMIAAPTTTQEELFDASSRWVLDYQRALAEGMAISVDLSDLSPSERLEGFSRIIVVGIRSTDPAGGQCLVEELVDRHHFSTGLGFLEYGTPTNNTQRTRSGYSETREDREGSYAYEVVGHPNWDQICEQPRTNAERLGYALGLEPESEGQIVPGYRPEGLRHLAGAGNDVDSFAREMQTALWPAAGDYILRYLMQDLVDKDGRSRLGAHFSELVRGSGPLPGIRVGDQPYGILPVTCVRAKSDADGHGWESSPLDNPGDGGGPAFDTRLHAILAQLYLKWSVWAEDPDRVPRVNASNDPDQELLQILAMEPISVSYRSRPIVDERFIAWLLVALREHAFGPDTPYYIENDSLLYWVQKWATTWHDHRREAAQFWSALTQVPTSEIADAYLLRVLSWWNDTDMDRDLVRHIPDQGQDGEETPAEYLEALCTEQPLDSEPKTLLRDILERSIALAKEEDSCFSADTVNDAICSLRNRQQESATDVEALDIDRLFRQSLDLCTHRLDAWLTSLATKRLHAMRDLQPSGLYVGAYGWVENLHPRDEDPQSEGYIHAPSTGQAAAAAVLHNAYLSHADGTAPNPFRINLSSERVRRAFPLLEGMRQGQPLGVLLGYQFERALHERYLDPYIDNFRLAFPLVANKVTEPDPEDAVEEIAARNLVDGLAMARWWHELPPDQHVEEISKIIGKDEPNDQVTALETELTHLLANLDAVSDLLMYEGVYQAVQGNFERAGAALDAASGNGYPPQVESVVTPASGKSLAQRVCILMSASPESQGGPRSDAEPSLAVWVSDLLGNLANIACRFAFKSLRTNINEATAQALGSLPGILDPADPQRVVDYRERHGPFMDIDHLDRVEDIHPATVACLHRWGRTGFESEEGQKYYDRIDVNETHAKEISTLPGIGPDGASAIVSARPYVRLSELETAAGIDAGTIDGIRRFVTTGVNTLSAAELDIAAIDLLYLSASPPSGEETEIEERIAYFVRQEHGLEPDAQIDIDFSRPSQGFPYGLGEALELCRHLLETVEAGSALEPGSFDPPQATEPPEPAVFESSDVNELKSRVCAARTRIDQIIALLERPIGDGTGGTATPRQTIDALFDASRYGVSGAIPPSPDDPLLDTRRRNVLAELSKRAHASQKSWDEAVHADPDASPPPGQQIAQLVGAMKALFGRDFVVLPTFTPPLLNQLVEAFSDANLLAGLGEQRVGLWLQQAAQVHRPLAALEDSSMMCEAWQQADTERAAEPPLRLQVAQLPYTQGDKWLALDDEERGYPINADITSERGYLSLVAAVPGSAPPFATDSDDAATRVAGLLLDQWDELIPSDTVETSVSFQYDAPSTQAPQALLLAVPSQRGDPAGTWGPDELAEMLVDTMDLAKVRAVDLDAMREIGDEPSEDQGVGLVFPALMFPTDPTKPGWVREGLMQTIEDWLGALLEFQCKDFRRELDVDVYPIGSPSIKKDSFVVSGLIDSSALLKGSYHQGSHAQVPYSALAPGSTEIQVDFALECLVVRFLLAWMDASIEDVQNVEDLEIGIAAFDKDGTAVEAQVTYKRIEDTRLHINVADARFPLFALDVKRPGIKRMRLNLGDAGLVDGVCYKSALNVNE